MRLLSFFRYTEHRISLELLRPSEQANKFERENMRIKVEKLGSEECYKHKERLTGFYYANIRACSYLDSFTHDDAERKIDGMIEHVTNGSAMVIGALEGDELVGYVWAYEHPFREEVRIYVNEIHVHEDYRGKGIGRELLKAVESMARERGYRALYIHTEGNNAGAIRLYQNEGYEIERVQLRKAL